MQSRVQVIVVAYNSAATLQRCIDALETQSFTDWDAVVWDNASSDHAVERLRSGAQVKIVRSIENLGFAAGNNRAAELSRSEYIAFLNPDAFAESDWLDRLVAAADTFGVEAVASLQLDDSDPELLDGAGDCMSIAGFPWRGGYGQPRSSAPTKPCEVFSACGAAALYRRSAFEALGGFEERFFCYCEDVDLGFRLRNSGGRCLLEPRALVRHVGGASSGGKGSDFAEYYGTRNRMWTFMRNMPLALMPLALPAHLLVATFVLLHRPQFFRIRLHALIAAIRGRKAILTCNPSSRMRTRALLRDLSWSPFELNGRKIVTRRMP